MSSLGSLSSTICVLLQSLGSCSHIDTCISNYYCAMLGITLPTCIYYNEKA